MNTRGPPKKVYKNNRIHKLSLPILKFKDFKRNIGDENLEQKKIQRNGSFYSPNGTCLTEKTVTAANTLPNDPKKESKRKLVHEGGNRQYKIVLSSNDIRQQGIFGVRSQAQYLRRNGRNSPVPKLDADAKHIFKPAIAGIKPVCKDSINVQDNQYKWLNGFSCTVGVQSKDTKVSELDVDEDFLRGFASALSTTFEEIIEECPQFKTGTKLLLMKKLDVYVRKQAGEESEADDTSGTFLTEYPQSSSRLLQGSHDRSSSRFDAGCPPNSLAVELSTSTLSTTLRPCRPISSPNWRPLQPEPSKRPRVLCDLGPYPMFQPKENRQRREPHSRIVPVFNDECYVHEPAVQNCNKKLHRASPLEYLCRPNHDYSQQFIYVKKERKETDHNTDSIINHHPPTPQNRGDSGIYYSGAGAQVCMHCHPVRCPSAAPNWIQPSYICPGHLSTFYSTVHPPPTAPPYQFGRINAVPRASFYPAGPDVNPRNYPLIYYQPFHPAPS